MNHNLGRRDFFSIALKSASRTLGIIAENICDRYHEPEHMAPDILPDLTPELLVMEAERLGLDPQKDRNRILESIQDAMRAPDT